MVDLAAVMAEHAQNVGFREGPNNDNPWGPEQGVGNHAAYCDSAASMVPHHHGLNWWPDCTFHDKGCSYTVTHVEVAQGHGRYIRDRTSQGQPAPLVVGGLAFFDYNHSGSVDHVETISALPQGPLGQQWEDIGYNTGPKTDGCYRLIRDRTYLHGVIVMDDFYSTAPPPEPIPTVQEDDMEIIQVQGDAVGHGPAQLWLKQGAKYTHIPDQPGYFELVRQFPGHGLDKVSATVDNAVTWALVKAG